MIIKPEDYEMMLMRAEINGVNRAVQYLILKVNENIKSSNIQPMTPDYFKGTGMYEACEILSEFYTYIYEKMKKDNML